MPRYSLCTAKQRVHGLTVSVFTVARRLLLVVIEDSVYVLTTVPTLKQVFLNCSLTKYLLFYIVKLRTVCIVGVTTV